MKQETLAALLGRSLTPREVTNQKLYLQIAKDSLEELLCISLETDSGARTFDVREGYSTVFTDIFTEISEVRVDGTVTTAYHPAFWDKRSNKFYNSIVLHNPCNQVEITAEWGFDCPPKDLEYMWAQLFADVSKKYVAGGGNVKRKGVEDFSVWYGDLTDDEAFMAANARTIKKYSMCNIGYVLHGETCAEHGVRRCGYCL